MIAPAYEELIRQAGQGDVVYNDDTTVKILELMGQRAKKSPPPDDEHDPNRTGLFTSGVVATLAGVRMAVFFSGRQHAGENLPDVLKHRVAELEAPMQMCDGLARNLPQELETILANCLAHGRRNFVELYDRFPDECRHVIEAFQVIYHNDKVAREGPLSAEERLAYHQAHSKPTMDDLQAWLQRQLDDKLVEPNSALGEAINYLLRRWEPLTLFLRKAGAPLDNNICERALKKAIDMELTAEERSLILRHGYPFERIEQALKACASSRDIEIVPMDLFELERLIGDLCISINEMNGGALQGKLSDLCDRLEAAEKYGDGMLEEI